MTQANGAQHLSEAWVGHVLTTTAAPHFETKLILCECSCLVAEQVVDLSEIFMQVQILGTTIEKLFLVCVRHMLVVLYKCCDEDLNQLYGDHKLERNELVEHQEVRTESGDCQ
jgi:hypothetical protein